MDFEVHIYKNIYKCCRIHSIDYFEKRSCKDKWTNFLNWFTLLNLKWLHTLLALNMHWVFLRTQYSWLHEWFSKLQNQKFLPFSCFFPLLLFSQILSCSIVHKCTIYIIDCYDKLSSKCFISNFFFSLDVKTDSLMTLLPPTSESPPLLTLKRSSLSPEKWGPLLCTLGTIIQSSVILNLF